MSPPRILHLLSQRPGRSGSGVFLTAMVREAAARGYRQHAVAVGPPGTSHRELPPLGPGELTPILFPDPEAPFPAPGNSDVMPYPSSVFSKMSGEEIEQYLAVCRRVLLQVRERFRPDIVHAHHLFLMTAMAREVFHDVPMIATSHNAELRQMIRAPWLVPKVLPGVRDLDRICVLTPQSIEDTVEAYGVDPERIRLTGAGYRSDLFAWSDEPRRRIAARLAEEHDIHLPCGPDGEPLPAVTFIGRLSSAKGVPQLLAAVRQAQTAEPFHLLLVGAGGSNADGRHMDELVAEAGGRVHHLGAMPQEAVAQILRCSRAFVLSSLFEGLPLVMLEAAACGCPCLVAGLPTVESWVPESWRETGCFERFPALQTTEADRPVRSDIQRYVEDMTRGLERFIKDPPGDGERRRLAEVAAAHDWSAVFDRYQNVYAELGVESRGREAPGGSTPSSASDGRASEAAEQSRKTESTSERSGTHHKGAATTGPEETIMGGKHGHADALGKGHHKGGDGAGSVHIELRPELAKELHGLLTAALAGHGGKFGGKADAVGHKGSGYKGSGYKGGAADDAKGRKG